jgi:hypothetical protein
MFDSQQKSTGTQYTVTVAYLLVALVFSPAVLLLTRPLGYVSVSLAIVCSVLSLVLARMNWKNSSRLTIPSIATETGRSK